MLLDKGKNDRARMFSTHSLEVAFGKGGRYIHRPPLKGEGAPLYAIQA